MAPAPDIPRVPTWCNKILAVGVALVLAAAGCGGLRPGPDPEDVLELAVDPSVGARSRLRALARDEDPAVRVAAIQALAEVRGRGATRIARRGLRDPSGAVRATAVAALAGLRDRRSVPLLARLLRADDDWRVRLRAVEAISALEGARGAGRLATALQDPLPAVRRAAASELAAHGEPRVEPDLLRALSRERSWPVRVELVRALAAAPGSGAGTALEGALRDDNEFVRIAARVALDARLRHAAARPSPRPPTRRAAPAGDERAVAEAEEQEAAPADDEPPADGASDEEPEDPEEPPPPPEPIRSRDEGPRGV